MSAASVPGEYLSPGGDLESWRSVLRAIPVEMRCELAYLFDPVTLRAQRLAERDAILIRMAAELDCDGSAAAARVHAEVARYHDGRWRFESAGEPHDRRHELAHRVLRLNGGRVPAARSLRRLFSGRGQNSRGNGHADRRHLCRSRMRE
jgi:hypothetical protein